MKVNIEFDLFLDELENVSDEEKFYAIEEILNNGVRMVGGDVAIKEITLRG